MRKFKHSTAVAIILTAVLLTVSCSGGAAPPPPTTAPPVQTLNPPPATTSATTPATSTPPVPTTLGLTQTSARTLPPQPAAPAKINFTQQSYIVFAWNDLGMHCANPTYDQAVLLPPYNTVWAQVIKRGNPPQVVTTGLTVSYRFIDNTYSYGKEKFGQFWDNAPKLFGAALAKDTGLNLVDANIHNGLTGNMVVNGTHFELDGAPLVPVNDDGTWNPFQQIEVTVKDASGAVVAQTRATAPVSDEFNCAKCHGQDAFQDILQKHDARNGTRLASSEPVLCASCHADPALGSKGGGAKEYLSGAIHSFHSTIASPPACYDCHPGAVTQCTRSLAHTAADGNCTTCHGQLAEVGNSVNSGNRVPWVNEPRCVTCHAKVAEVDTGNTLYRNATGHGNLSCPACHSSPHAMTPSRQVQDNWQALQYMGRAVPIGSCAPCHRSSKGAGQGNDFMEEHGGPNPRIANMCDICHTAIPTADTSQWPHDFQWKARQGTGTLGGD